MTRKIKFRAWDKEREIMASEYAIFLSSDGAYGEMIINTPKPENYILLQYTGLKDKNGADIYCSDLVKHKKGLVFEVANKFGVDLHLPYSERYNITQNEIEDIVGGFCCGMTSNIEFEVIGNIYQNPELLKEA